MYGYERIVDWIALRNLQMRSEHWLLTELLVWSTLVQLAVIGLGMGAAFYLARPARKRLQTRVSGVWASRRTVARMIGVVQSITYPGIALVLLCLAIVVCSALGWPYLLLSTWVNLLGVWIIIRMTSNLIKNETLARLIAVAAFTIATLNILDLVQPTILFLDSVGTRVGGVHLSVFEVLKGRPSACRASLGRARGLAHSRAPDEDRSRPDPIISSANGQADPHFPDHGGFPDRVEQCRYRPDGIRRVHRRGRRRRWFRAAEAGVEPDQRRHPAARPVDQAGRCHRSGGNLRLGLGIERALRIGDHAGRQGMAYSQRGPDHSAGNQPVVQQRTAAASAPVRYLIRLRRAHGDQARRRGRDRRDPGA